MTPSSSIPDDKYPKLIKDNKLNNILFFLQPWIVVLYVTTSLSGCNSLGFLVRSPPMVGDCQIVAFSQPNRKETFGMFPYTVENII
jgi:hypothetical protein